MYLLQAQNLTKTFGTRTLFRADQLELHDGDRVGLVGENGAGKSTLLDIPVSYTHLTLPTIYSV